MTRFTKEEFKRGREIDIVIVAEDLGIKFNKYNQCCCVVHKEDTPSMILYKNRLKCHGCGTNISTIDLYARVKQISLEDALDEILKKYSINCVEKMDSTSSIKLYSTEEKYFKSGNENKSKVTPKGIIKNSTKISNIDDNNFIKEYLTSRHIPNSIELLKKGNVDVYYNDFKDLQTICFYDTKGKFMIRKGYNKKNGNKVKLNCGKPDISFFNINNIKEIYICEGMEDALSFMHVGRNAISLNSTSNIGLFIERLYHWKEVNEYKFFIATDNDNAGIKCREELQSFFQSHNIKYKIYDYHIKANCNDINELWVKKCNNI